MCVCVCVCVCVFRCGDWHTAKCAGFDEDADLSEVDWLCEICTAAAEAAAASKVAVSAVDVKMPTAARSPTAKTTPHKAAAAASSPRTVHSPAAAAAAEAPVAVTRTVAPIIVAPPAASSRPALLALPLPLPSGEEDEDEVGPSSTPPPPPGASLAAAPARCFVSTLPPMELKRSASEQFESAPTPRIAPQQSFEESIPTAQIAPGRADHSAKEQPGGSSGMSEDEEVPPSDTDDNDVEMRSVTEEEHAHEVEVERDEEAEAIASTSATPAPSSPAFDGIDPLLRSMSTAITPPLSPSVQLSQDDERESSGYALSMDSPTLPFALSQGEEASSASPSHPQASLSNASGQSRSSTLTKMSVHLNGESLEQEQVAPATSVTTAAAAAAAPRSRVARSPQTLQRTHATAAPSNHVPQVSPNRRSAKRAIVMSTPSPAANGGTQMKERGLGSYMMKDLREESLRVSPSPAFPFHVAATAATCEGWWRIVNQDDFVCEVADAEGGAPPLLIFCVADGHGILGHLAAHTVAQNLPLLLKDSVLRNKVPLEDAVKQAIAKCHKEINDQAEMIRGVQIGPCEEAAEAAAPARRSSRNGAASPSKPGAGTSNSLRGADYGTTIVVCVIQGARMCVAHVGDSRCMLLQRDIATSTAPATTATPASVAASASASAAADDESKQFDGDSSSVGESRVDGSWRTVFVSTDHTCDIKSEHARVLASGGSLLDVKDAQDQHREYRVYPATMTLQEARVANLTINMSRALGHIKLGQTKISMHNKLSMLAPARHSLAVVV